MSYALAAVHFQPLVVASSGGGGAECDPYTRPSPTAVVTVLGFAATPAGPTGITTVLCAPVS